MTGPRRASPWLAIRCHGGREAEAEQRLRRQGYEAWLPLCRVRIKHARKTEIVLRPLFPRYLFLALTDEALRPVENTPGVAEVLRTAAGKLARVPVPTIECIRSRVDADGGAVDLTPVPPGQRFSLRELVRVSRGPFAGHRGLFVAADRERVWLLLDLLGGQTTLELTGDDVEKVS